MLTQFELHGLMLSKYTSPHLPFFIKGMVEIKGSVKSCAFRLYPRNTPEILINFGDKLKGEIGGQKIDVEKNILQGSKTKFVNVIHPGNCHFISVRFKPNGFYKLLGIPQSSFTEQQVNLENVIDDRSMEWIERIKNEPDVIGRFQLIIKWLTEILHTQQMAKPLLSDHIINEINYNPRLSNKELVERFGYSRKHLWQKFKEEAGMSIKEYQIINRLYRTMKDIQNCDEAPWSRIIYSNGYYDQSHFIREFKKYTGYTPTEFKNLYQANTTSA